MREVWRKGQQYALIDRVQGVAEQGLMLPANIQPSTLLTVGNISQSVAYDLKRPCSSGDVIKRASTK